jgi:hypothetical protein
MTRLTHIIYVAYQPLTQKLKDDFYIEKIQKIFKVEYWDISAIYHKNPIKHEDVNENFVKDFFSLKQLEQEIIKNQNALFIFNINYYAKVYKLFRIFSKCDCKTAFFARGALPFPLLFEPLFKKLFLKFKAFKNIGYLKKAFLNQLAALARKLNLVKPFTYVFYAGLQGSTTIGYGREYGLKESELIPVNSFDFDKYLLLKNETQKIINESYCVFLDAYLPYHPDFDLLKMPKVNAASYYTSLNNFFDYVEATCNIKVVIAAHPRSKYESSAIYKGRAILKYKTAELIKDAGFVLAHASTSISFAVMFAKPVVFIYNSEIKKTYPHNLYPQVLHFAEVLNTTCINVDEGLDDNFIIPQVNENAYSKYKYNYLTNPESENKLTENIFIEFLKNYSGVLAHNYNRSIA